MPGCPPASSPCRSTGGAPDVSVPNDLRYTRDHEWLRLDGEAYDALVAAG